MTQTNIKQLILSAAKTMLRPVIRILIHNGVTYSEFCKLAKMLFVDVCANDFGLQGRPTNMSRIATMTGIDRKEVKRVKDALADADLVQDNQNEQDRLTRILSAWHQDALYLDESGEPLDIPIDSTTHKNFTALVKAYGGDIPVSTILKELINSDCVERLANEQLRVLKRFYVPANNNPESLLRASAVSNEILHTMFHNLYRANKEKKARPRFERRASNNAIPVKHAAAFEAFVEAQGQAMLERVDAWLTEHEHHPGMAEAPSAKEKLVTTRMGVGAYLICHEAPAIKKAKTSPKPTSSKEIAGELTNE